MLALWPVDGYATTSIIGSERDSCADFDWIVIGKVVKKRSFMKTLSRGESIVSQITFEPERVVHGDVPPTFDLTVLGGRVGDHASAVMGQSSFPVGSRHVLFIAISPYGSELMEHMGLRHTFELDPAAELPPEAVLQAIWAEHCDGGAAGVAARQAHVTAPYVDMMVKKFPIFRDWCHHY